MSSQDKPLCVILGGGGHARMLIDCIQMTGLAELMGILEVNETRWGESMYGVEIKGGDDLISEMIDQGVTHFVVGVGGTRDNQPRQRLFDLGLESGLKPLTVRYPGAFVSQHAVVGEGCHLMPMSVVNAGAALGMNVIVNSGAIVEHDCVIGDHVHIATGARLSGTVTVGSGTHVGAGATIRQSIAIGSDAVVGAGAVVVKDVPDNVTVVGVPARVLK
ncbi:MAG: acetyltransferase [Anaerolineae bacterium]|nr:acetyltransferase [Anaerolineae bacterium]